MKVFKCDRCSEYFDSKGFYGGAELSGQGLLQKLRAYWYPESVDLCRVCADLLRAFLAEWWKEGCDEKQGT